MVLPRRVLLKTLIIGLLFVIPVIGSSRIDRDCEQLVRSKLDTKDSNISTGTTLMYEESIVLSASMQEPETIAVIVESSIFPDVSDAVFQYRKDLNDTGYQTILYTNPIATAEALKALLSKWYEGDNLVGAVLIGRLPYALFHHDESLDFSAETFICDLFLMDLDGQWSDAEPIDGVYETHSGTPLTDRFPEIFVGRIDPSCLTWGSGTVQHIINYLSRIHDYRTGGVQRSHRAIAYIDDDWSGRWGARWSWDLGLAYDDYISVRLPTTDTNATDWRTNRLTQNYQWGHLCAHSSATTHYFGPEGSGEGTVSSSQVRVAPPSFNFYNLFCCSGAKWTSNDNLAVTYTFSGDYSLATIGSSKTGSMMDCDYFYRQLSQNTTLGESLIAWFSQSLTSSSSAGTQYLEWYYGMNIVGDPLLSIYFDTTVLAPHIVSTTHPEQSQWYTNHQPQINWTVPPDVNEIEGYYFIIDQDPSTNPEALTGTFTAHNGTKIEHLDNGTWYFHVVARDSVGNIGTSAEHFMIRIDTTPPDVTIINPVQSCNYSSSSMLLSWLYHDDYSDYSHTELTLDSNLRFTTSELSYQLEHLSEGVHTLNLTLFDKAGNSVSEITEFRTDLTNPEIMSLTINEQMNIWPDLNIVWLVSDITDYKFADVTLDCELIAVVIGPECSLLIENSEYGPHVVNVTIFDWTNRSDSFVMGFTITNPRDQYIQLVTGCIVATVIILVGWRKLKH